MMDDKNIFIPSGWVQSTLGDACDIVLGQSPPSDTYNSEGIGLPFFQGKTEFGDIYPTPVKWCSKPQKLAKTNDVLISVRAPVGPTNLCKENTCIGRGLAAIRPRNNIPSKYLLYYLRSIEKEWDIKATGTTFKAITGSVLRNQEIPLAPLTEQEHIVERIESLFSQLDAGVAGLKRAKGALKRYKASVLNAACEGRLVPQDLSDEPGCEMLKRLNKESPIYNDLPKLSEGWCWARLDVLAANEPYSITDGPFGSNLKTEHYTETGPRVVRLQNIGDGIFNNAYAHISIEHFNNLSKHQVFPDDVVIAALGDSLPRACIVPIYLGPAIVKADCIRFKPNKSLTSSNYLNVALNSYFVKKLASKIIHGVGRPRMNQTEIKSLLIPLPPIKEQQLIVEEVERRLSVVQELEQTIEANLMRSDGLRQAILEQAFEGRLTRKT